MGDSSNLSLDEPWTKPSRFKEHLSFASNHNSAHEVSRFSPDTPSHLRAEQDDVPPPLLEETRSWPLPPHNHNSMISFGSSTFKAFSPPPKMRDLEQGPDFHDVELDRSDTHRTRTTFRDRMSRRLLEFGLGKRPTTAQLDLPIQDLPSWPPLNIHKHTLSQGQCCAHCKKRQEKESAGRKWRTRILIMITIILLLWLLGNTIALNIATFRPPSSTTIPDVSDGLNFDRKVCLSQFRVDAPSNPKLYPCAQCLSLLEQIPSNATSSYGTAANAAQFCSVRSLWEDADAAGQAALEESGWVRDVKFCSWGGIQCNGAGQISSIQLTAPAIPAGIPSQLSSSGLPGLETFQIVGNTTTPTGPLPPSFASFNLTTLHLESTGLQGDIPGTLQSLSTLALVRNPNLSSSLPDTVTQGNLKSLIVTNENLTLSQTQQAAFCSSGRLSTCDLRESGIASCGSCHVA